MQCEHRNGILLKTLETATTQQDAQISLLPSVLVAFSVLFVRQVEASLKQIKLVRQFPSSKRETGIVFISFSLLSRAKQCERLVVFISFSNLPGAEEQAKQIYDKSDRYEYGSM